MDKQMRTSGGTRECKPTQQVGDGHDDDVDGNAGCHGATCHDHQGAEQYGGWFFHSLAFLCDPLVLVLEVRCHSDVTGLFLCKGLDLMVELLDCDLHIRMIPALIMLTYLPLLAS